MNSCGERDRLIRQNVSSSPLRSSGAITDFADPYEGQTANPDSAFELLDLRATPHEEGLF